MNHFPVVLPTIDDKIVIVTAYKKKLLFVRVDISSDRFGLCEVQSRSLYAANLTRRDSSRHHRREGMCIELQLLSFDTAGIMSVQVKIGMIRRI